MSKGNCGIATVQVQIATDNDAFTDRPAMEVARMLRDAATWIEVESFALGTVEKKIIRDLNGNSVGHVKVVFTED